MSNRIAIFGLTGDPFTIAHRDICKQALETLHLEKLYVIPTIVDYHRKGKERWLTDLERVHCMKEMLFSMGIGYYARCEIDAYELRLKNLCRNTPSLYTEVIKKRRFIHTLLDFKARHFYPRQEIIMIIGADELKMFPRWYRWDSVLDNVTHLCVVNGRDEETVPIPTLVKAKMKENIITMPLSREYLCRISASLVRECYRNRKLEDYLLDVRKIDSYETNVQDVPWIVEKEGDKENGK